MAEKMPDRIWAGLFDTPIEGMQIRVWSEKQSEPELTSEYLRSTPAREHAEDMRTVLRMISELGSLIEAEQIAMDMLEAIANAEQEAADDT